MVNGLHDVVGGILSLWWFLWSAAAVLDGSDVSCWLKYLTSK